MLGAIASERGDNARAQDFLRRAVDAAPNNEITRDVFRKVAKGRRVDAIRVAARLSAVTRARVAPVLQD
jgi:Tfp pilus assembly protein PilF